jgi:hypothetical protein
VAAESAVAVESAAAALPFAALSFAAFPWPAAFVATAAAPLAAVLAPSVMVIVPDRVTIYLLVSPLPLLNSTRIDLPYCVLVAASAASDPAFPFFAVFVWLCIYAFPTFPLGRMMTVFCTVTMMTVCDSR